jgi:hypothetical protein
MNDGVIIGLVTVVICVIIYGGMLSAANKYLHSRLRCLIPRDNEKPKDESPVTKGERK